MVRVARGEVLSRESIASITSDCARAGRFATGGEVGVKHVGQWYSAPKRSMRVLASPANDARVVLFIFMRSTHSRRSNDLSVCGALDAKVSDTARHLKSSNQKSACTCSHTM